MATGKYYACHQYEMRSESMKTTGFVTKMVSCEKCVINWDNSLMKTNIWLTYVNSQAMTAQPTRQLWN